VKTSLIKVNDLIKLGNLIVLTGKVANAEPVSMLLVGAVGTGKTQILKVLAKLPSTIFVNDVSGKVLVQEILPEMEKSKTHLLIADMLKVLGHNRAVVQNTVSTLNSATEEGVENVMFYGNEKKFDRPVRFGIAVSMTAEEFITHRIPWRKIGFLDRCILVTYQYSPKTINMIHDHIAHGFPEREMPLIDHDPVKVEFDGNVADKVMGLVRGQAPFTTGFRFHKQLRALLQAHALYCGRSKVSMADFLEVKRLSKFINSEYREI
jgi:hypothetical protein